VVAARAPRKPPGASSGVIEQIPAILPLGTAKTSAVDAGVTPPFHTAWARSSREGPSAGTEAIGELTADPFK
jgi:hypothetical protein